MKILSVTMMALLTGIGARAGEVLHNAERTVTVCVDGVRPGTPLNFAQTIASKMFAGIGVTIDWRHRLRDCQAQGIVIGLTYDTPHSLHPGALAYAAPFERTHIRLFCDRILLYREPLLVRYLLAHVLAHEITHVLQGTNGHSFRGIMKATWDADDYHNMLGKPLAFTTADIDLIYGGLAGRAWRTASHRTGGKHGIVAVTAQ
jgi:hypothetical protein